MTQAIWRLAGCALGVLALLAAPALYGADNQSRVSVKYPAKSSAPRRRVSTSR